MRLKDITAKIYDELNDIPNIPDPYGIAGWTAGDNDLLIYDRFDIWKVSPVNEYAPVRLTKGREENTVYRYQSVNKDSLNISPDEKIFLKTTNEANWQERLLRLRHKQTGNK